MKLTAERLRELFDYDPETGIFTRLTSRGGYRTDTIAGTVRKRDGYRTILVDYHLYQAHRLAFLWMIGHWPAHGVDHRNRQPDDNRWCNLREATQRQNLVNRRRKHNLPPGVYPAGSRWQVSVGRDGYIGCFGDLAEAAAAAAAAYAARGLSEFSNS